MLTLVLFWFCSFNLMCPSSSMVHGDVPLDDGPGAGLRVSSSYLSEGGKSSAVAEHFIKTFNEPWDACSGFKKLLTALQKEATPRTPCTSLASCPPTLLRTPSWLTQALTMKWVWLLAEFSDCLQYFHWPSLLLSMHFLLSGYSCRTAAGPGHAFPTPLYPTPAVLSGLPAALLRPLRHLLLPLLQCHLLLPEGGPRLPA